MYGLLPLVQKPVDSADSGDLDNEALALVQTCARHLNIVKLMGVSLDTSNCVKRLMFELADLGSLEKFIGELLTKPDGRYHMHCSCAAVYTYWRVPSLVFRALLYAYCRRWCCGCERTFVLFPIHFYHPAAVLHVQTDATRT